MAELATQEHRRSSTLDDDPLGCLRSAIRCIRYRAKLQHTIASAAAMLHFFDDRDLVTDTRLREGIVSMESGGRRNRIGCFAGRD